ncbi:MAG: response regulator [Nitrospinae bacterium]|nr:response regulator [Nitrospinota bacterium]
MEDFSECKVLVVDDSEFNLNVLAKTLADECEVKTAHGGESAIRMVESDPPDLILLDIMMPEMNGYEVCSRLKSDARTRDIPIVFLTAMDEAENRKKGFELGAVDYITKPFDRLELLTKVSTHLSLLLSRRELAKFKEK